jgi:hypothetical protein
MAEWDCCECSEPSWSDPHAGFRGDEDACASVPGVVAEHEGVFECRPNLAR